MHDHSLLDACERERGQGYETAWGKFQAGMRALATTGENYAEITKRLTWTIWINSDYLWDLAQLEDKSTQFLE